LSNCSLGDDVGLELGNMLASNRTLQRLELDYNNLSARSLSAIGLALLQDNATLTSLSLERNPVTTKPPSASKGGGSSGAHSHALAKAFGNEDVRQFLLACSRTGATFDQLTDSVSEWLKQTGANQLLRVRLGQADV